MSIRLVAIDMDGTTFNNQGVISKENIEAIQKACSRGVYVVPATGRAFKEVPEQIFEIEDVHYMVLSNGASVCTREGGIIYSDQIDYEVAINILELLKDFDVMTELYLGGQPVAQASKMTEESFRYYNIQPKYFGVLRDSRMGVDDVYAYLRQKRFDVEKLNLFFRDLGERADFIKRMKAFQEDVELTSSMTNNVEVNKRGANKGAGLAHLCCKLRIQPSEVLAMGDSDNDITMLRYADTAVAVGNACDSLKKAANYITVTNDEHAVARALKEFVFKE